MDNLRGVSMDHAEQGTTQRLSAFIRGNLDAILTAWDDFARSLASGRHVDAAALRDHAGGMLRTIADDLDNAETVEEQHDKAQGRGARTGLESQAAQHGAARVASGFTFDETLSEFRALRASVLHLWAKANGQAAYMPLDDTVRFNEAIDEALTGSMERYALDKAEAMRQFDTLLSSSPDLQCILSPEGRFTYLNKTLAQLFAREAEQAVGKQLGELCPALAASLERDLAQALTSQAPVRGEIRCSAQPGPAVTYRYVLMPVINQNGEVASVTVTARNISELKASEDKILRYAYYDSLTDLPNRMLFRDRLEQEVRHAGRTGRKIAVLYIDLDGFKEVNDRFGHQAGDKVLQEAARRISGQVRVSDTVARLGGDEFTVILTEVGKVSYIDALVQDILRALAQPFEIDGHQANISGSIGVALFPDDGSGPEDLIRNADQAMFAAKKSGRNGHSFFTQTMRDSAWARQCVLHQLRHAVADEQLRVHYQPIVSMATGAIVKAEALVRWQHPECGLVLPDAFIGLAEESGLIGAIDAWVLEQALGRAHAWSAMLGTPFQVSVNKSPSDFMVRTGPGQSDDLARLLQAGSTVAVEITEGVMLSDSPGVRAKLRQMHDAGVKLTIDDFGIGYSSMAYLKKFKVDFLKIDKSFVRDMMESVESRVFAETIVLMAHRLGLEVIAEGVETPEQRDWLKAAGCDFAQGFLYSEARDVPGFEALLGAGR
ncbi:EAL domain-containing protein [Massilia sp. PAMC28688]|uniref:putative bifunctional diguanylate cyclase/phosphodiesterase n=1 Tax=Massilia sp. PAMC28688 TaxID=2861283 RepID=UPI001C630C3F|nr:EAL domain-containing protein [Massilia sp. PAMC28688]QYF92779.1 EAL domain-containing protein [Massilia sp. PAMC28688]